MRLIIGILLCFTLLTGCGQGKEDAAPQAKYSLAPDSASTIAFKVQDMCNAAFISIVYQDNVYYPAYKDGQTPNVWQAHPEGFDYMYDEWFGYNTIAEWFGGNLWVNDGTIDASVGFFDWGALIWFHLPNDPTLYQVRHNFYLDKTLFYYQDDLGVYHEAYLPKLDWENALPPVPTN